MPLPEYARTWLTEFDESSEPVDCSMISLILYTRLAERQTRPTKCRRSSGDLRLWSFTYAHEEEVRGIVSSRPSMMAQTQQAETPTIRT